MVLKNAYLGVDFVQSFQSMIVKKGIELGIRTLKRRKTFRKKRVEERRRTINSVAQKWMRVPLGCKVEPIQIEEMYAEWISNNQCTADKIILYIHGGAYGYCSTDTHRALAARIMTVSGVKVLLPEYRLAPEHPFPAALEDTLLAYHWLLNQGFQESNIILAGDSAGGGLCVASTLLLRDRNEPLPAAVICLSPWMDLTSTGESYRKNKFKDPYITIELINHMAKQYVGKESLDHPLISPVYADFHGFPPLYIQVGSIELVLSDAVTLAQKAKEADVDVQLTIWKGMWHIFQISRTLPEARQATRDIGQFMKKAFSKKSNP
jgi:epsilon-lactone hydrolase